jgi:hypothetical protein
MQVWHHVSEQLVIHVARREYLLNQPGNGVDVAPERGRFLGGQARKVGDVPISKDDNHVPASDGMRLEVSVANGSHIKRLTEVRPVPTKPAARAFFPVVPILRPCSLDWFRDSLRVLAHAFHDRHQTTICW